MKSYIVIFGIAVALLACDFFSLNPERGADKIEIWKQVAVRYPATAVMIPTPPDSALTLKISGDSVMAQRFSNSCPGHIGKDGISLDACTLISPYWHIVERSADTMYIYPRMGAMYYYDLVMKKMDGSCAVACAKQPETGPCKALVKKYYFDKQEGRCKEFVWGGCEGVVPFETFEACESCRCNRSSQGD
jgi:Kunitz/Bovine pancreatic trypsin inhibitor domain